MHIGQRPIRFSLKFFATASLLSLVLAGNALALTKVTTIKSPVICNDGDLPCLIKAAKICAPARLKNKLTVDLFGVLQTGTSQLEIKGLHNGKCIFYEKTLKNNLKFSPKFIRDAKAKGTTDKELQTQLKQSNELAGATEGRDGTCQLKSKDLVVILSRWRQGSFSTEDLNSAQCSGSLFSTTISSGINECLAGCSGNAEDCKNGCVIGEAVHTKNPALCKQVKDKFLHDSCIKSAK